MRAVGDCEKPLELDASRARALVVTATAAGHTLGVVLQHRFRPAALRAEALLAAGVLGRVAAMAIRVPWWRPQSDYAELAELGRGTYARDGGVLMTQAVHTLNLAQALARAAGAPAVAVSAARASTTALRGDGGSCNGVAHLFAARALATAAATQASTQLPLLGMHPTDLPPHAASRGTTRRGSRVAVAASAF